jgi:hypothetical protein
MLGVNSSFVDPSNKMVPLNLVHSKTCIVMSVISEGNDNRTLHGQYKGFTNINNDR